MGNAIIFLLYTFIITANAAGFNYFNPLEQKLIGEVGAPSVPKNFMASFRHNNTHLCSAVLITNKQLLTAAHCLRDFMIEETVPDFEEYEAVVRLFDEDSKKIHLRIEEVQIPIRFNPYICIPALDIGVITLLTPVTKSEYVDWMTLENTVLDLVLRAEFIGLDSHKGNENVILSKRFEVKFVESSKCYSPHQSSAFCVSTLKDSDKFTEMDIGAPLIQDNLIIGILSTIILNEIALFANLHTLLPEIRPMLMTRRIIYARALPRKRVKYDYKEKMSKPRFKRRKFLREQTNQQQNI